MYDVLISNMTGEKVTNKSWFRPYNILDISSFNGAFRHYMGHIGTYTFSNWEFNLISIAAITQGSNSHLIL